MPKKKKPKEIYFLTYNVYFYTLEYTYLFSISYEIKLRILFPKRIQILLNIDLKIPLAYRFNCVGSLTGTQRVSSSKQEAGYPLPRKLRRLHARRRRVYVQHVGSRLEVWPQVFSNASGILYNLHKRVYTREKDEGKQLQDVMSLWALALRQTAYGWETEKSLRYTRLRKVYEHGETKMIRLPEMALCQTRESREARRN